jgi:hypothetical protein
VVCSRTSASVCGGARSWACTATSALGTPTSPTRSSA